jgi:UrcA family protein
MNIRPLPALASFLVNVALLPALVAGLTLPGADAHAAAPSVTIRTSEFAARSQFDYPALYGRIGAAAAQVCEPYRTTAGARVDAAFRRCVALTVDETIARVNDAALSAYHRQRTGGYVPAVVAGSE